MPSLTFQFTGLSNVINKLKAIGETIKQDVKDELNATALEIVSDAQNNAPIDLGNLRANIGQVPVNDGLQQQIYSRAEYSAYMEFGTGTNVSINSFGEGFEELVTYAAQFKGAGLEGKHPVLIKGRWVMVPYQLNLLARPFFFPAVQKGTLEMIDRLKKILKEAEG